MKCSLDYFLILYHGYLQITWELELFQHSLLIIFADSSPEGTNISRFSSIAGEQRGRSTERTFTDTLLASGEESLCEVRKETAPSVNTDSSSHGLLGILDISPMADLPVSSV